MDLDSRLALELSANEMDPNQNGEFMDDIRD